MRTSALARKTGGDAVKEDIDDGRGVESEYLAEQKTAHHGDAQRAAQLGAFSGAKGQGNARQKRGHGSHHNGTEAQQAGLVDRVSGVLSALAFAFEGKVDHHDA